MKHILVQIYANILCVLVFKDVMRLCSIEVLSIHWFIWYIGTSINWLIEWVIHWLIEWVIEWVIERLTDWWVDWLAHGLIGWLIDWLIDGQSGWLIDGVMRCLMMGPRRQAQCLQCGTCSLSRYKNTWADMVPDDRNLFEASMWFLWCLSPNLRT